MKTAAEMSEPEVFDLSGLCGTSVTGCRQRAEYAVFLLEGGSTVRKVLGYVDPPECTRRIPCDWTSGWRNWKSKESRKSGRNKETCQLDGRSDESSKDSGIFPIMDKVLAKEAFE